MSDRPVTMNTEDLAATEYDARRAAKTHKLFIARIRGSDGPKPLVTVRAAAEGEARLFLEATYPDAEIESVVEPSDWASDADTGSAAGDVRAHPGVAWQPPSGSAG